ncbi:OmpA family protein [Aliidiomarina taiwanensis]|nr:OmpA family protein [Aliidiomarina taiwanensis]
MIKSARFTLPALLAGVMAVSPQALASFDNEELSLGLRLGVYNLDSARTFPTVPLSNIESGFKNIAPGIQLNTPLTKHWSVRTSLDYLKADVENGTGSKSGYSLGVDALYNLDNGVYLGPGFGSVKVGSHVTRAFRATAGFRKAINDRLYWSGEYNFLSGGGFQDHALMFGLNMSFGDKGPAIARVKAAQEEQKVARAGTAAPTTATSGSTTMPTAEEQGMSATAGSAAELGVLPDEELTPRIRMALAQVDRTSDADGDGIPDYRDVCPNTPRGHTVDARGCSVYEEQSQVHHLRVTFGFDSSRVPERYYDEIRDLAVLVGVNQSLDVLIEGHTDLIGTAEYNQALSERRAQAVADILINQYGIDASRITTVGHGMEKPVVNRITLDANARNRRIETTVSVTSRD